jgi:hypothetical protein
MALFGLFRRCSHVVGLAVAAIAGAATIAQPTTFVNLGTLNVPATPNYARSYASTTNLLPSVNPPIVLNVRWAKLVLPTSITGDLYLDVDSRSYSYTTLTFAMYDNAGNFIAANDTAGSFAYPDSATGGLSFGSSAERVPWITPAPRGIDGTLQAGTYWLALVAGTISEASFAPNWNVSTPASQTIGFGDGQAYYDLAVMTGNTTSFPTPPNDDCANATIISENVNGQPAWTGNNFGATQDGFSPCYPDFDGMTFKDVWFRYVPQRTGWVRVSVTSDPNRSPAHLLTAYDGDCGSSPIRCAGGGSFVPPGGIRFFAPVTEQQPLLIAVASRAGQWGTITLNVNLLDPPCDLDTPANAQPEIDAFCGDQSNDGCVVTPFAYEPIQLGDIVSGTLYTEGAQRDYDWFSFSVTNGTIPLTLTAKAQIPVSFRLHRASTNPDSCRGSTIGVIETTLFSEVCGTLAIPLQYLENGN